MPALPAGKNLKALSALAFYAVFFFALFAQFPAKRAVPGNCDTVLLMAAGNDYLNRLSSHVGGGGTGAYFYGSGWNHGYGESAVLGMDLYILGRSLGLPDYAAYYFFISAIFISSAFAVFLLAGLYTGSFTASLFAGFAFSCSNFAFANIDDSILLWYFLPVLSIYFLKKHLASGAVRSLYLSAALAAVQVYVSGYVFVFGAVMLAVVLACGMKKMNLRKLHVLGALSVFAAIAAPYFAGYLHLLHKFRPVDPWDSMRFVIPAYSLKLRDLAHVLPGNLLYRNSSLNGVFIIDVRLHAFLGGLVYLLAAAGIYGRVGERKELVLIALAGLIMAAGVPGPMAVIYGMNPIFTFLRMPVRAFFMASLSVSLLAGIGVSRVISYLRTKGAAESGYRAAVCFFIFHFFENTPFPLRSFDYEKYYRIPAAYGSFFRDKKDQVVLDLPSCGIYSFSGSERPIYGYNREAVYMLWQTHHKQNVLNGSYAYFPGKRLELQRDIEALPRPDLFRKIKIDYIVYHKNMRLREGWSGPAPSCEDGALQSKIAALPGMAAVYEDEDLCIIRNSRGTGS